MDPHDFSVPQAVASSNATTKDAWGVEYYQPVGGVQGSLGEMVRKSGLRAVTHNAGIR